MKIEKIFDKGVGPMNEDQLLVKDNLFVVFDGATSLNKYHDNKNKTGGFLASFIAKKTFSQTSGSLMNLAKRANKNIREEIIKSGQNISIKENSWSTGFAAVKIHKDHLEWAQIADCLILLLYKNNSHKLLVQDYDHDEEVMIEWKKLSSKSRDEKWQILMSKIIDLRKKQNITYGMLDGENKAIDFIKSGIVKLENIKHVIIFTDGLIPLKENPSSIDNFDKFICDFTDGGLIKVKNHIRKMEDEDPECQKFPRYKKHDDIAAISISF